MPAAKLLEMPANYTFDLPERMQKLIKDEPSAPGWIARLPSIVDACVARWDLMPGPPFADCYASLVLPVTRAGGSDAVLKINIPNVESDGEHAALAHWDGNGAVRLLDAWQEHKALLIERCLPGDELWTIEDEDEAARVFIETRLRALKPAPAQHSFTLRADVAARWGREMPLEYEAVGASYDRRIVNAGIAAMLSLGPNQGPQVVLHQDLHGGNILRSHRDGWLIIDPKPLVGELDFDVASYLRDRRWLLDGPDGQRIVQRRLDMLAEALPIDRQRARLWALGHAIAWGAYRGVMYGDVLHAAELIWRCK